MVSEETRGRRKRKSDRVYYFIKCFGAQRGLGSKIKKKPKAALCVTRARPPATWELYPHIGLLSSDTGGV